MKISLGKWGKKKISTKKKGEGRGGISFLLILTAGFFGGAAGQYTYTYTKTAEFAKLIEADRERIQEVQQAMLRLKFFEDRRVKIENNHKIYDAVRTGPSRKEEIEPFPSYGFEDFGLLFIKEVKQPGIQFSGNRTEFQRILTAVAQVEAKYPLLQFTKLQMSLPDGTRPLAEAPTYLDCSAELYSPRL